MQQKGFLSGICCLLLCEIISMGGGKCAKITLQFLTGKYRDLQGNPCNEYRDPGMRTGVPCNKNRFFPVGIGSQGVPCELYRVWVCSAWSSSSLNAPYFHLRDLVSIAQKNRVFLSLHIWNTLLSILILYLGFYHFPKFLIAIFWSKA